MSRKFERPKGFFFLIENESNHYIIVLSFFTFIAMQISLITSHL